MTVCREYFTDEMESIGDPTLNKELKVLDILTGKIAPTGDLEVDDWKIAW